MNREVIDGLIKARRTLERNGLLEDAEPFDAAIKALEQEPCEDAISKSHFDSRVRQAIGMVEGELTDDEIAILEQVLAMLATEPSVQPQTVDWDGMIEEINNARYTEPNHFVENVNSTGLSKAIEIINKHRNGG